MKNIINYKEDYSKQWFYSSNGFFFSYGEIRRICSYSTNSMYSFLFTKEDRKKRIFMQNNLNLHDYIKELFE